MDDQFFTAEDLITNEGFIDWVNQPNEESNVFWKNWLIENPDRALEVEEAREFILSLSFNNYHLPKDRVEQLLQNVHQEMGSKSKVQISPNKGIIRWKAIAAVLLIGILGWTTIWFLQSRDQTITTTYNQTKDIILPDGSSVILNADSDLQFAGRWGVSDAREVWLDGEAFFSVVSEQRKAGGEAFIVHTGSVDVEVLGTTFNVNRRGNNLKVVLTSGEIKLKPVAADILTGQMLQTLQPGEMAVFLEEKHQFEKKEVNTNVYTSWKTNQLVFDSTSFDHLVEVFKYNYGFEVMVKDSSLLEKHLSGTVPNDNPEDLIKGIAAMFEIPVKQLDNQKIVFGN